MSGMQRLAYAAAAAAAALLLAHLFSNEVYSGLLVSVFRYKSAEPDAFYSTIRSELSPRLSTNCILHTPDEGQVFKESVLRWQDHAPPAFIASVHVQTEEDIQNTIRFANDHGVPFLATSGKHGDSASLGTLRNGLQIDMRDMDSVSVSTSSDGHVVVGGGTRQEKLIDTLALAGRRTVTGVCGCVGMGLLLGGGHGFLQGQYGLMADQLVSARIILANSTLVTTSASQHPDLFWAIRGAGHNFGIITEFTLKTYPLAGHENWSVQSLTYPGSQIAKLYTTVNDIITRQPPEAVHMSILALNPAIDPVNPVLTYIVFLDGSASALAAQVEPLQALKPLVSSADTLPYTALSKMILSSSEDAACQRNVASLLRFPVDFHSPYNTTAMRRVYDLVVKTFQHTPELNQTWLAIEGYSDHAVRAIPDEETAFPFRGDNILISPFVIYNAEARWLDKQARDFGEGLRAILQEGTGRKAEDVHGYVNYANGMEKGGIKSWYGFDEWRLDRLRKLKREWDPERRFPFYAPID